MAKAETLGDSLIIQLELTIKDTIDLIHQETGFERFVIGGSWAAEHIASAISTICSDDAEFEDEDLTLKSNDIDCYHGNFCEDDDGMFLMRSLLYAHRKLICSPSI